jgi:osmotically inducible protein OsmC
LHAHGPTLNSVDRANKSWRAALLSGPERQIKGQGRQPEANSRAAQQGIIIMSEKSASIIWNGAGKAGLGQISTESGALQQYPYGFASRFGDDRQGSNPEELLAAAHAACFTMAFSFACEKAGFATATVDTSAHVRLTAQGEGFVIDRIVLNLTAAVPGLDEARFQDIAAAAKRDCPLSKALASVAEISLLAALEQG